MISVERLLMLVHPKQDKSYLLHQLFGEQILGNILAFVEILIDAKHLDRAIISLKQLPNLMEVYQVAGAGCNIVSIVSASDIEEFRDVLKNKIMKIAGVKETMASVSLASYKGLHSTICAETIEATTR
jgi:DNA-binding Lrp family transcriptional regulator